MCHTLNIFGHPTFYREIATGLTALAMTVVVVTQLRRFKQNAKLKFETILPNLTQFVNSYPLIIMGKDLLPCAA